MDNLIKKFIESARKIRLEESDKFFMRQNLISLMENNPVRNLNNLRQNLGRSKFKFNFLSPQLLTNPMPLMIIAALLIGGGTSFAAESALPGDILYLVKVGINEEVRGWASLSSEDSANWEVQKASRRLDEAEKLASQGKLDTNTSVNIEENFGAHADAVNKKIEDFKEKKNFRAAADVSSNFETSLKAHENIIAKLAKKEAKLESIHQSVRMEANNMIGEREDAESRGSLKLDSGEDNSGEDINDSQDLNINAGTGGGLDGSSTKFQGSLRSHLGL